MVNEINSPRVDHTHPSIDRDNIRDLSNKQRLSQTDRKNGWNGSLGWWLKVILLQGIIGIGLWLLRGWWKGRRVHGKIL